MIIITDRKRLLNLNNFAIYLMLTPDEKAQYGDKLKSLNRYSTLTKGLFHFDIVEKGDTPYDKLPEEMIRNMSYFNVMVRVVNTIRFTYCYGMERIDLEADIASIVKQLKIFVEQVCEMNIFHLDILRQRDTTSARLATQYYKDNHIVIELFEAALKDEIADKNAYKLWHQDGSTSLDMKSSLEIARSVANNEKEKQKSIIEKERCEREMPDNHPLITMTVKMVKTGKEYKDGRPKMGLGVEMNIDGNIVPVYFGSTDRTFLYIIVLISQRERRSVKRSNFLPLVGMKQDGVESAKNQSVRQWFQNWLRIRYNALLFVRDFEDWYRGVKEDPHPLDVAMGGIKKKLWEKLYPKYKDAYYYCLIINNNGCYRIRIDSNNICIDPEILRRMYGNKYLSKISDAVKK